jgi:type I restriction enzyme, S subunit
MSFPRYTKYTSSGIECVGEMPAHWNVAQLRRLARICYGIGEPPSYHQAGTPLIRATNVHAGSISEEGLVFVDPSEIPEQRIVWLDEGDIIVVRSGAYTGDSAIIPAGFARSIAGFDMVLKCHSAQPQFIQYVLLSTYLKEGQIDLEKMRAAQPHLNSEELGSCRVALPTPKEQVIIAEFLDRETAKIDALVAEQRRLMELLKEKRQAVISHAVTKGLNPHAPMKDSGIEWLGKIPAHWELRRLRHISPFIAVGIVVNPSSLVADEGLPFIYGGDIREGTIDWENARRIDAASSAANSKTQLHRGDLLTVRVGAPGVTAVVPDECENGNCASVMLIRRGEFNSDWLCYAMNARVVRYQVEVVQYGAAQEQFNIAHAVDFWAPVPPRHEQDELAALLAKQVAETDSLMAEAQRAVDLLIERRTALISAAVTGQIDVRNIKERRSAA